MGLVLGAWEGRDRRIRMILPLGFLTAPMSSLPVLTYSHAHYTMNAIRATLEFANVHYQIEITGAFPTMTSRDDFFSPEEPTYRLEESGELLSGWHTIFMYASRLAHTWPSDALGSARVDRAARDARYASLDSLKKEYLGAGTGWMLAQYEDSTAADFMCIARLRSMQDNGHVLPKALRKYARRNPALKLESDDDENDESEVGSDDAENDESEDESDEGDKGEGDSKTSVNSSCRIM